MKPEYPIPATFRHKYTGKELLYAMVRPHALVAVATLPRSIDLSDKQSPVFMQNWGSCVMASERSDAEAMDIEARGSFDQLSVRAGYAYCKNRDGIPDTEGTYPYIGKKVRMGIGYATEQSYPDVPTTSHKEYTLLPPESVLEEASERLLPGVTFLPNPIDMKHFLANERQLTATVAVYSNYLATDSKGITWIPSGEEGKAPQWGYHRIVVVGFDDDLDTPMGKGAWKCKNSWGTGYGINGYFYVPYAYGLLDGMGSVDWIEGAQTVGAPLKLALPVDAPMIVTQPFGANPEYYKPLPGHTGVDIRARLNAPIYAIDEGTVTWAQPKPDLVSGYGNCVIIQHSWGVSLYGHLSKFETYEGKKVGRGELIGRAGYTGRVREPREQNAHLHLQGKINGVKNPSYNDWVNLEPYLKGATMPETKIFRVNDHGKLGIMILEGFTGTIIFENEFSDYEAMLKLVEGAENAPVINIP